MKRVLVSVVLAAAVFVAVGAATGVLEMAHPDYCVDHPHRPPATESHEERLSLLPPGPECRFFLASGETIVEGPGWIPALVAVFSVATALIPLRIARGAS